MISAALAFLGKDPVRAMLIAAVIALCGLLAASTWTKAGMKSELAAEKQARLREQLAYESERTKYATALADASEKARRLEQERLGAVNKAREDLDNAKLENASLAASIAASRRDASRVRDQLATYALAAASRDASSGTCAASQSAAGALATSLTRGVELLEEGRFLLRIVAKERDDFAAEVAACLTAWPK